jgi:glutamate synthase (NADPH/NADH) large chain
MVDLDPLDEDDVKELHAMISKHSQYTNSAVARFVLTTLKTRQGISLKSFLKTSRR